MSVKWCVRVLSFHINVCVTLIDVNFCTLICLGLSTEATSLVQYLLEDVCIIVNFAPQNACLSCLILSLWGCELFSLLQFYRVYLNARWGFLLKLGAEICEIILNFHMKHWTRLRQTGSCRVKPRPASQNHHMRSLLFWDITHRWVVIYLPTFQDNRSVPSSRVKKSERENRAQLKLNESLLFWDFVHHPIFLKQHDFSDAGCFHFQATKHLTLLISRIELFSNQWAP